jgi:hypothetical protein
MGRDLVICSCQSECGCSTCRPSVREASASSLLFPDCFFPQPLDLLQLVRTVFRHHLHVVCNGDPMVHVPERYAMSALLPGIEYWVCGWDDFIVQDVAGRSYSIPTVPLDFQYLSPFNIPPNVNLVKAERCEGKVKWYVKPIGFGGDPKAEDNITWVSHEQHAQLVRWWNNLHRSVKTAPKPM